MKIFKNIQVAMFSILSAAPFYLEAEEKRYLQEVMSDSTNVEINENRQAGDSSRIYLSEGAIWAVRDITRFEPVLRVSVADKLEVKEGKLANAINFRLNTNFSYYISRYQIEIYRGRDRGLSEPITILSGGKISNDYDINWDGSNEVDYQFAVGEQLQFRLKVWDADGNLDVTTVGVTDLVSPNSNDNVEIDRNQNEQEKGRSFGQAQLMRHNIPTSAGLAKFIGTGLKGVDRVIIGEDEFNVEDGEFYVEQYLPADAYVFPTRVILDSGEERRYQLYVRIPDSYYTQAGLADFYLGRNFVSGNANTLAVDYQYQDDIYNQGRIAYFSQGKFGDKLRLTTHFDSKDGKIKDIFDAPFASDSSTVFDIVEDDDEMFYGDYGDSSSINKVVNTQGKVYLDVEYDKSSFMWGNYNTGLTGTENNDYNRSLYGFKADYRTRGTTQFGEDRLNIVAFASDNDSLYGHDEFLATGGSLYFLRHGEVATGSDKVYVKVVNKNSGITESEVALLSGRDYDIDAYQGRIILTKPLSNILADNFSTVLNSYPSDNYDKYLAVDYEYVPTAKEAMDSMAYGGRVKGWLNDYIGIGATYATEEKDSQDYEVYGADLTLRATEGSYIKTEFAHSSGKQTDSNFVSYDGGLSFVPIGDSLDKREGDSIQVQAVGNLYDLAPNFFSAVGNDVQAWYKHKDAGYSYASQSDDLEQDSYGTQVRLQVADSISVAGRFSAIEEADIYGDLQTDSEQVELETQFKITDHIKLAAAAEYVNELNLAGQKGDGTLAGLRADYIWDADTGVYIKGQKTVDSSDTFDENDSITVGGEARVFDDFKLGAEYTTGDRGEVAQAGVTYDVTDSHSTYLTYIDDNYEGQNNVIVGQRADLTSSLDFYQENQFVNENNGKGQIDSYGFGYEMNEDVDFGLGYQQGEITKPLDMGQKQVIERRAVTFSLTIDLDDIVYKNKIEYRVDEDSEATDSSQKRVDQYVTTNNYRQRLTEEYTLFGKYNWSRTISKESDETLAKFVESSIGLAYRPIYHDRLNLLSRYTYIVDYDQLYRDIDYSDEVSHIIEIEAIYSLTAHWDIGGKYAYKNKTQAFERASGDYVMVESDINLYGISLAYRIMKDWDITGEYHWKTDTINEELEHGALLSFNKHVSDNFKVGIGYNFSGFDSNLANEDYDSHGVFVNLVGKI